MFFGNVYPNTKSKSGNGYTVTEYPSPSRKVLFKLTDPEVLEALKRGDYVRRKGTPSVLALDLEDVICLAGTFYTYPVTLAELAAEDWMIGEDAGE